MPYDNPVHWHGSLRDMLARAERVDECASKTPGVPAAVLQFAPRKDRALPAGAPHIEIPGFLKGGPRAAEDVILSGRKSLASRQGA
jgi:hypothetical protein